VARSVKGVRFLSDSPLEQVLSELRLQEAAAVAPYAPCLGDAVVVESLDKISVPANGASPVADTADKRPVSSHFPCDMAAADAPVSEASWIAARPHAAALQSVRGSPRNRRRRGVESCFLRSTFCEHDCFDRLTIWPASRARVKVQMVHRPHRLALRVEP
jgi:hypothetical protein